VVSALRREIPDAVAEGYAAGMHLLLRLPADVDEERYVKAAGRQGVAVLGTSPMYGTQPPHPGVVLGYGRASTASLEEASRRLAVALAAARGTGTHTGSTAGERPSSQRRPSTAVDYFVPSPEAGV